MHRLLLHAIAIGCCAVHAAAQPAETTVGSDSYLEVPLRGEVGKEITALGVRDAIRLARSKKADAVVFVIDTPGGVLADADAIARVMDQERQGLRYYAIVVKAISAGIWPLSRANRVFFPPGSAAGAAVAFSRTASTGNIDVDAKLNAAHAATVSSAADAHGQPGCVYRAMMVKEHRLFVSRGTDGTLQLTDNQPAGGALDLRELDSDTTVLALTTKQAIEIGFGSELPSNDAAAIGGIIGAKGWRSVGKMGIAPMNAARQEVQKRTREVADAERNLKDARKRILDLAKQYAALHAAAVNADPERMTIWYYESSGMLTPNSQIKWRKQSDIAIAKWNDVKALTEAVHSSEQRARQALNNYNAAKAKEAEVRLYVDKPEPLVLDPIDHGLDLDGIWREASDALARIYAARKKYHIDR